MYKITETKIFSKKFVKINKSIFTKSYFAIKRLQFGPPFEKQWNVHKLKGNYNNIYSINITGDWRLLFDIDKIDNTIILLDIGTHSELYK